jgi:regulatory protein
MHLRYLKKLTPQEAKEKIQRYCAYQERSHQEVRKKLFDFGLYSDEVNEIISHLITSNFLNEERFARAFAGGKFRMKRWGRIKIVNALEAHGLSTNCIRIGLKEIDNGDYEKTLYTLIEKKADDMEEENLYAKRDKLSKFVIQKGYEPDLAWKIIRELFPDQR